MEGVQEIGYFSAQSFFTLRNLELSLSAGGVFGIDNVVYSSTPPYVFLEIESFPSLHMFELSTPTLQTL